MVKRLAKGSCDWRNLLYFSGGYLCLNKLNNPEHTAWTQTEAFLNSDRLQPRLYLRGCFKGNKPRHEDLNVFVDFSDCLNQPIEEIADKILKTVYEEAHNSASPYYGFMLHSDSCFIFMDFKDFE